jgi:hypothetical protein
MTPRHGRADALTARGTGATMSERTANGQSGPGETVRELYELIAALDRRVPHVERVGEVSIARAAAALRTAALKRIEELERDSPDDAASVDA